MTEEEEGRRPQKWCEICEGFRPVRRIDPVDVDPTSGRGQRFGLKDHPDVQYFRRGQVCQDCGNSWISGELPEELIIELGTLRNQVVKLRASMDAYVEVADQAAKRLVDVRAALDNLDTAVAHGYIHIKPRSHRYNEEKRPGGGPVK